MTVFRYILSETGRLFLFIFVCLFLVVLMGFSLQQMHKIGGGVVLLKTVLPFLIGYVSTYTAPVALLLAAVIVYQRMARDQELTALQAAGFSKVYLARPVLLLATVLSLVLLYVNFVIIPESRYARENFEVRELEQLLASSTQNRNSIQLQNTIFRYESIREGHLQNVHVVELTKEGRPSRWFAANRGQFLQLPNLKDPMLKFQLEGVTVTYWESQESLKQTQVMRFKKDEPFVYSRDMSEEIGLEKKEIEAMTLSDLYTIARLDDPPFPLKDYPEQRIRVEINRRVSLSLAPVAFMFLCVPLAMLGKDQSRAGGVSLIVLPALVLFYPAHLFAVKVGETTSIIPSLLFWPPLLLFSVIGYVFIHRGN